uniref:Uncharacterized protein n=1 Tax=Chromera velia CCMP2878 TaxID=1169474 RepID=A0A0G4IBN3_9ALVE|eukprot:Cvel_2212.t1-p1 / transcript=Cvel_2212.t1 / gene=Cvel_2212 / organism=Chromera_velia_CCMP2878 / gene_product=hypothetical protein / transcript_product=hypothetical protein / location=Cvel_scaffold85:78916-80762(-) / protein_length=587 / sequence_SO=supercontig / SO=protein_coding / is_pseudo=false
MLDAGARVDVCEWGGADHGDGTKDTPSWTHHIRWNNGKHFLGKTPLHSLVLTLVSGGLEGLATKEPDEEEAEEEDEEEEEEESEEEEEEEEEEEVAPPPSNRPQEPPPEGLSLLRRIVEEARARKCLHWGGDVSRRVVGALLSTGVFTLSPLSDPSEAREVRSDISHSIHAMLRSLRGGHRRGEEKACEALCNEILQKLEGAGADLRAVVEDGHTALSKACLCKAADVALFLQKKGTSHFRYSLRPKVPLIESLTGPEMHISLARSLLNAGADPNEEGVIWENNRFFRVTPLQLVSEGVRSSFSLELFKAFIEKGARCPLSARHRAATAAAAAAAAALPTPAAEGSAGTAVAVQPPVVEVIAAGVGVVTFSAVSPLALVCSDVDAEDPDVPFRLLLEKAGADPNLPGVMHIHCNTQVWPLQQALQRLDGRSTVRINSSSWLRAAWRRVEMLVAAGAQIEKIPPDELASFETAEARWLCGALSLPEAHGPLLERIIRHLPKEFLSMANRRGGRSFSAESPFKKGLTPLGAALEAEYTEGVRVLVEAGADVSVPTSFRDSMDESDRCPPLVWADRSGQTAAASFLQNPQ